MNDRVTDRDNAIRAEVIEKCIKIVHEITHGMTWRYKIKHCEFCRDGETAARNTGLNIIDDLRALLTPADSAQSPPSAEKE